MSITPISIYHILFLNIYYNDESIKGIDLDYNKDVIYMAFIDITGQKFGRLTVIKEHHRDPEHGVYWECNCDCGTTGYVTRGEALRSGRVNSCGCLQRENASKASLKDIIGQKFGKLTVIEKHHTSERRMIYYLCRCDCGNTYITRGSALRTGHVTCCDKCQAENHKDHGLSYTKLARKHASMIQRCYDKNSEHYPNYGGRGIYICDEWYTPGVKGNPGLVAFVNWSYENGFFDYDNSLPYNLRPTLDRIDVNGPYAPWNCRYVTNDIQQNNKRNSVYIYDIDGTKYTAAQFERKYNLRTESVVDKLNTGWSKNAIVYAAHHPEEGIHLPHIGERSNSFTYTYHDKDGFIRPIPNLNPNNRD